MNAAAAPTLTVDLQGWPGIVVSIVDDRVVASNGCLEKLLGGPVVGRSITELLDTESSRRKWERIVAATDADAGKSWELVFRGAASLLEPRTFSRLAGADPSVVWLIEHPFDRRVEAMGGQMQTLNADLSTTQRALVKEQGRLAAALKDLERSNAALDEFAHAASHDLKAPLRAIIDYAELLETEAGQSLAEEPRSYLGRIHALAFKMRGMIDAVLEYARVGRATSSVEKADSGRVLRDVLDFLAPPADIEFELASGMPVIEMERVPFEQVFRNLFSNAIKYRRAEGARVCVTVSDEGTHWKFIVADNGPGIAASQHQRIWGLFHTSRPQEGTGIGLALVKRIVESQGGRVFVESTPGNGARFGVAWPKRPRLEARAD